MCCSRTGNLQTWGLWCCLGSLCNCRSLLLPHIEQSSTRQPFHSGFVCFFLLSGKCIASGKGINHKKRVSLLGKKANPKTLTGDEGNTSPGALSPDCSCKAQAHWKSQKGILKSGNSVSSLMQ